eukprot:tig00000870_g5141.t1
MESLVRSGCFPCGGEDRKRHAPEADAGSGDAKRMREAPAETPGSVCFRVPPSPAVSTGVNVEAWINANVKPYDGTGDFLAGPTARTKKLLDMFQGLCKIELEKGVLDVDPNTPSTLTSHGPGFFSKGEEVIVGLQTDAPLKRAIKPFGGVGMVKKACEHYGYKLDPTVEKVFNEYRKTHNQGVFDIYDEEMKKARHDHIITGLPDAYGRGRIIGDYRRVALYGVDRLIQEKKSDQKKTPATTEANLRAREELSEQVRALQDLKKMALSHGPEYDIGRPAGTAREAVQWTYFGYLGAIKQQDGAAMSLGRLDAFFDVYIERDLAEGRITEEQAQEMIDDLVIKLRSVRFLRTPEYNDLFAGDPTWVTMVLAGADGRGGHLVTRTSFRILQTLYNLGPAPEPNLTVLWAEGLPENFKRFCARVSIDTSSIQYENDDVMRPLYGTDYGIACCVSPMAMGKQMQFFGARCNLAKLLLADGRGLAGQGCDEVSAHQVGPKFRPLADGPLDYEEVMKNFDEAMEWLAGLYVRTMNTIHYAHDKYCYESLEMALHDTDVGRNMAFGIAGLSVVADSLSAIKHARVTPVRDARGLATAFAVEGDFPKYGNDDDRVDSIATMLTNSFITKLRKHPTYRNATHTLSILTITSNVVYGKNTGATPDGRPAGEAFAPGASPMHGRDVCGALASLNSVAKLRFSDCQDGISNTFSVIKSALGHSDEERASNLVGLLGGYFGQEAHHLNVNVLNPDILPDAVEHPEKYPNLTIRVSGYAVNFVRLTKAQQLEVIHRTFHQKIC